MSQDITIWLDPTGGFGKVKQIAPRDLMHLEYKFVKNINDALYKMGVAILNELIWGWQQAIHTRPRTDNQYLQPKLMKALQYKVSKNANELWLGVFDLLSIDRSTRNEGFGTRDQGWFLLFEDGHNGQSHGASDWKFITIDTAMELAQECAAQLHLQDDERAEFLGEVRQDFQGRHGEGIMVNLTKPLFFKYPQFGARHGQTEATAGDILGDRGHPGFHAWNVIAKTLKRFRSGDRVSFVDALVDEAFAAVAQEI